MIYHCYFAGILSPVTVGSYWTKSIGAGIPMMTRVDPILEMVKVIKSSPQDTFIFIITSDQQVVFNNWLAKYELNDLIMYQMPQFITNPNYPDSGRRLKMYVLSTDEAMWADPFTATFEEDV